MTIEKITLDSGEIMTIDTNQPDFKAYLETGLQMTKYNKDDAFFFARNLEYVRQTILEPAYAELKLLNGGLLPINSSIPAGAETDTYDVLDSVGEAKVISDFSDTQSTVEVTGKQYINKIVSIGDAYIYSQQDLRRDQMVGGSKSVIMAKAMATRRAIDQKLEKMLGFGDSNYGITGLFNNANVPLNLVAATGTGGTPTTWSSKTSANILADIETAINDMINLTNGNEIPTGLLVDATNYHLISKKALDTTNYSGMTILKYIEANYGLTVNWVQQLKNGFVNNTKSGFVLYQNRPEKVEGVVPMRLMPYPPQVINLATKNIIEARCGGTRVFFPYSVSYSIGI